MGSAARRIAAAAPGVRRGASGAPILNLWNVWSLAKTAVARAFRREVDDRRLILWTAPAAASGALLYFQADRQPSLSFSVLSATTLVVAAALARGRAAFVPLTAVAAILCGFASASLRTASVAAPVLSRVRIVGMTGYLEEVDPRSRGARVLIRVASMEGIAPAATPYRVRVTTRKAPDLRAGDFVALKARLSPPAQAAIPGGYDFALDAYFARIGAVGNALGAIRAAPSPGPPPFFLRVFAKIDQARNALAARIARVLSGPAASVAVAMVTGKRDFLDDATKDVIRQAGIFHIITISGVQMTLVAGIVYWFVRRLLSLSRTLALNQPIKVWAALIAMAATIAYDLATGSRIGAQRALVMTLVMLGAVICGRRALSMRNLAFAAGAVILFEPEAIMGASFQLSFAAVTALVAVQELRRSQARRRGARNNLFDRSDKVVTILEKLRTGPGRLLFATACATCATAIFMAYDFHELSPYVLIGNPLTFAVIEFFAVPCALIGALLYPLGLDAPVWRYLGSGIDFILWAASKIAEAPGATIHLVAFAPAATIFCAAGMLSLAIWRTPILRATALPLIALGLLLAVKTSRRFDAFVAPDADAVAVRAADGRLVVMGRRPSAFVVGQWLAADGDGRAPETLTAATRSGHPARGVRCDASGCVARDADAAVALVLDASAFAEDCARADVVVSRLEAPPACGARLVLDRDALARDGAVALRYDDDRIARADARAQDEDRPWSRAPDAWRGPPAAGDDSRADGRDEDPWRGAKPF